MSTKGRFDLPLKEGKTPQNLLPHLWFVYLCHEPRPYETVAEDGPRRYLQVTKGDAQDCLGFSKLLGAFSRKDAFTFAGITAHKKLNFDRDGRVLPIYRRNHGTV